MKLFAVFILAVSIAAAVYGESTTAHDTPVQTNPDGTSAPPVNPETTVHSNPANPEVSGTTEHIHVPESTTAAGVSVHSWSVAIIVAVAISLRLLV
jgi:disulfide bond formation protein DsbB